MVSRNYWTSTGNSQVGIDVLIRRLPANLMELAMVDGGLWSLERKLLDRFCQAAHIDADIFDRPYSALVIK